MPRCSWCFGMEEKQAYIIAGSIVFLGLCILMSVALMINNESSHADIRLDLRTLDLNGDGHPDVITNTNTATHVVFGASAVDEVRSIRYRH